MLFRIKGIFPKYRALEPNICSIFNNLLYFAILSERDSEPVLMSPLFTATAKSAIKVSSVSPERWEIIVV